MPYKKPKQIPFESITRLLKGYDLQASRLSKVLGCSVPTARAKLAEPSKLTLKDLSMISRYGHVHWDEIRENIKE